MVWLAEHELAQSHTKHQLKECVSKVLPKKLPLVPRKRNTTSPEKPFEELAKLKRELVKEQLKLTTLKREHQIKEHELRVKHMEEEHEWKRKKYMNE